MSKLPPVVAGVDVEITRLRRRLANLRAARKALRADPHVFLPVTHLAEVVWDAEVAAQWLSTPVARFHSRTPLDLVVAGETEQVLKLLRSVAFGNAR